MNKLYSVLYNVIWIVFKIVHPWKVVGNTNLPEGGVLICGNHTSMSDPFYVALSLGKRQQTHFMAKIEVMRIPVLSFIMKKAGVIGIDRGKADVNAIKLCLRVLKNGENLLMFPEGTRVQPGEEGDAHSGAAMLATRTGVPILPVYIPRKKRWFRKTTIVFGEAYFPQFEGRRATSDDYKRISSDLMARIGALEELTQ